jgi:lysyl-tRNA synthetase class 2
MDLQMLEKRAAVIRNIRSFFDKKQYLELDTPLLSPDLIPESCLEVFETAQLQPIGSVKQEQKLYLVPSPEIWMKKIIARHSVNVYQICKCFRNGESTGRLHSPEFTMLEYYTMEADYMESLALTEELFSFLASDIPALRPPFIRITVEQAFERWAGFNLYDAAKNINIMEKEARRLGLEPAAEMSIQQLYDLIFIHAVEPQLKGQKPAALIDYPAFVPCLAKQSSNGNTVERWELYCNGIELANCYSEETNPEKIKEFFKNEEAAKKDNAIVKHKVDNDYWKYFKKNSNGGAFPRCSGVALGIDRFIMAMAGYSTIDSVLPFPLSDI